MADASLGIDLDSVVASAEASFGMALGADVVGGPEGAEVAASEGAFATTIGDTVFLGEEVAALGPQEQAFVLTHELAHIAQQHAGGAVGDAEGDADRMAGAALAGASAEPAVGASSSEAHDLSLDDIQRAGSAIVDGAQDLAQAGADLVAGGIEAVLAFTDPAELVAWLTSVDEDTAKQAVSAAASSRGDLVEGFVQSYPTNPLAGFALACLPESSVAAVLQQLDSGTIALLLAAVPATMLLAISGPLILLSPAVLVPALLSVPPELRVQLLDAIGEDTHALVGFAADLLMPAGTGVKFACDIAATFGVPVRAGGGGSFEVINRGAGSFEVVVTGEAALGCDTGIGAGGSVGVGGGGMAEGEVGVGLGGEASAGSGFRTILESKFEPELSKLTMPSEFLGLLAEVADGTQLAEAVTNLALGVGIYSFHRSTTQRMEVYVEGGFEAGAGLRTADESTLPAFTSDQEGANGGQVAEWWQAFTKVAASMQVSGNAGATIGIETPEWGENEAGVLEPKQASLTFEGSSAALVELSQSSPVPLPDITDLVSQAEGEYGVKAIFPIEPCGASFSLLDPDWTVTVGAQLNGYGMSAEVEMDDLMPWSYDKLLATLTGAKLEWSMGVGAPLLKRSLQAAMVAGELEGIAPGVSVQGTVKLTSELDEKHVRDFLEALLGPARDANRYAVVGEAILRFLQLDPSGVLAGIDALTTGILAGWKGAQVRLERTASLGGEGSIAKGVKAEIEGSVGVTGIIDTTLPDALEEEEICALIRGEELQGDDHHTFV